METAVLTKTSKDLRASRRTIMQGAKMAIRDIYDALAELITNADDRYQVLGRSGRIEIEVERRRGSRPSIMRVRDFADGMTAKTMDDKLSELGGRVSGLERGLAVRGTNSRGAKDVAALGHVTFESIAADGQFHRCAISPFMKFTLHPSKPETPAIRKVLGISSGTGTIVTIEVDSANKIPQHDNLLSHLERLVSLRDIISDPDREIVLRDVGTGRTEQLVLPSVDGHDRVKETIDIPGYPGVTAKLVIKRAKVPFENQRHRFRQGGIVIKSRHAVHEATLFDAGLEKNPHARWFYGRLVRPYIDQLSNASDERFAKGKEATADNPMPIVDPRRTGLTRGHPFVKALFGEALKRLRPLVEEERLQEERTRATIESRKTRQRLNALERAALKFMEEFSDDEDISREPEEAQAGSQFRKHGCSLSPPFSQIIEGHSRRFWLNVHQATFPELQVGDTVEVQCLSTEIEADRRFCSLEEHPLREGVLRARWNVTAKKATPATGLKVRVRSIVAEASIEVLKTEADRYAHISALCFQRKRYRIKAGAKRKKIRILAPLSLVPAPQKLVLDESGLGKNFSVHGDPTIAPVPRLGIAVCELHLKAGAAEARGKLVARLGAEEARTEVQSVLPAGAGLKIKLEDIDLANQRSIWRQNVLEIAARHPSLRRYLGDKAVGYPGQESKHFRLLLAEIVSDAVCARMVSREIQECPEDWEEGDWDMYYAAYSKYMTRFLPIAHKLQCPEGGTK
jgi:hypothetical protein